MAKRASKEEVVLTFFREQPIAVANSIFNLVKGELRKRNELPSVGGSTGGPAKVRRTRKKKIQPVTSTQPAAVDTSFNTAGMK